MRGVSDLPAVAGTLAASSAFVTLGLGGIIGVIGYRRRIVKLLCGLICVGIGITGAGLFAGQFGIGTALTRGYFRGAGFVFTATV